MENTLSRDLALSSKITAEYGHLDPCAPNLYRRLKRNEQRSRIHDVANIVDIPHPSWKLSQVIPGHRGWVRCLAIDMNNEWFATGSCDQMIKIWDLVSGTLRLSLTGHVGAVRGLAISTRHPYLFSTGEDKQVKCWDLEQNKVVRHYHGHFQGVYTVSVHPTLDLLVTGGRDSVGRVWDMRSRQTVVELSGHGSTISKVQCLDAEPPIITASHDSTLRLWDLKTGKPQHVLTHHKKSVRAMCFHPNIPTFASGSSDSIKKFCFPDQFQHEIDHESKVGSVMNLVNTMAVNEDNVLFVGYDSGEIRFCDWNSGKCFQHLSTTRQHGSLECESAILASAFDKTGVCLVTGEADKTIKIWKNM